MRDGLRPKVGLLYALQPGATEGLLITLGPLSLRGNARDLAELCCVGRRLWVPITSAWIVDKLPVNGVFRMDALRWVDRHEPRDPVLWQLDAGRGRMWWSTGRLRTVEEDASMLIAAAEMLAKDAVPHLGARQASLPGVAVHLRKQSGSARFPVHGVEVARIGSPVDLIEHLERAVERGLRWRAAVVPVE